MPISIIHQLGKLDCGERVKNLEERRELYEDRPLTAEESVFGYHKCPLCGFPTKNRYRCHGCWAATPVSFEEEGSLF